LKPEKCSWGLLAYHFKEGRPQIHTPRSYPAEIFLQTETGAERIKRVPASKGVTVVGVVQALNGQMKPQVDKIQEKASDWAKRVKGGWMNRQLAWTCLRTMIWPSLAYPLQVCSMTKTQGDAIVTKLYQALLPELGLQKRFPKVWRYAPRMYQALALPHPFFIQGQEQISIFQQAGLSEEINGGLLQITTDQAQLEIGRSTPLLQEDFTKRGHLLTANLWIGSLWEFCSEFGIKLEADRFKAPEIQRDNDSFIMELLEERFTFTGDKNSRRDQWRSLNRCRMSLQVLFLSDIASGDGKSIRKDYLAYEGRAARPHSSKWEWPLQNPTAKDWTRWTSAMQQISSPEGALTSDRHLGPWIRETHQHRPWRFDPIRGYLLQYNEELQVWKSYRPLASLTRRKIFEREGIWRHDLVPLDVPIASVLSTANPNRVIMEGFTPLQLPQHQSPQSIEAAIVDLGQGGWPLADCSWDHAAELAKGIQLGTAIGVADGSYMPERSKEHGTTAWLLQKWNQRLTAGDNVRRVGCYMK
jgi:hypothetical protein